METKTGKLISEMLDRMDPAEQAKIEAKMILAAKIADAMKAKGWKNADLLRAVGKDNPSIVTKWLSGTHNFTIDTLVEIEEALGIRLLEIEKHEEKVVSYFQSVSQTATIYGETVRLRAEFAEMEEPTSVYSPGIKKVSITAQAQPAMA